MYTVNLAADKITTALVKPGVSPRVKVTRAPYLKPGMYRNTSVPQLSPLKPPAKVLQVMSPQMVKAIADSTGTMPPAAKQYSIVTGAAATQAAEPYTAITETPAAIPAETGAIATLKDFYAKNPIVVYAAGGVVLLLLLSSFKKKRRK